MLDLNATIKIETGIGSGWTTAPYMMDSWSQAALPSVKENGRYASFLYFV
jgi:hypothetical protein